MMNELCPTARVGRFSHARRTTLRGSLTGFMLLGLMMTGCQSDTADDEGTEASAPAPGAAAVGAPAALDEATVQRQMELMGELQAIDQALLPLRTRALEDSEIQGREQALIAQVDAAMEGISPGVLEARDRFETLRLEYTTAQQAGQTAELQTMGAELQSLQARIQQTQQAALAQQDVTESIESFRERLFAWMRATDPAADSLLDRAEEISDELEGMAQPGGD